MSMRVCEFCGRNFKTTGGFHRHEPHCQVLINDYPRKKPRCMSPAPSRQTSQWTASMTDLQLDVGGAEDDTINRADMSPFAVTMEDINASTEIPVCNSPSKRSDCNTSRVDERDDYSGRSHNAGRKGPLTTSSCVRVETYTKEGGRRAGTSIAANAMNIDLAESGYHPHSEEGVSGEYHPFPNAHDYALAQWFHEEKVTKGARDRFFHDTRLAPLHSLLSYKSADELEGLEDDIACGIDNDEWTKQSFTVQSNIDGIEPAEYSIIYRDITKVLRFLLGHRPFKEEMVFEPIRQYNSNDKRVYTEIHTGDWWWETQDELPDGATVVPLLISTDKTALTRHKGDLAEWPVYLTLGNLKVNVRRAQKRPGLVLLGLLPIVPNDGEYIKSDVWHKSMSIILDPIRVAASDGIQIMCADENVRSCHPIIAGFMVDHEEAVIITGVKSGRQCTSCTVLPDQRGDLQGKWPLRTHSSTQSQIQRQQEEDIRDEDDTWVHPVDNFAWLHPHVNIHGAMLVDILHQLLKGSVEHLLKWLGLAIEEAIPSTRRPKGRKRKLKEAPGMVQLDERFRIVPAFLDLKTYNNYSAVAQWTGKDRRSILRQLIPVIAPLLTKSHQQEIHCARALVDFVFIAQYRSHDDETLAYLRDALYRFDKHKACFQRFRPTDKRNPDGHFNIPKLHAMTHYEEQIRRFGAADNYSTEYGEAAHRHLIKPFFELTNKRDNFREQLARHATRHLQMLAMEDNLLCSMTRPSTLKPTALTAKVLTLARQSPLSSFHCAPEHWERNTTLKAGLDPTYWSTPSAIQEKLKIDDLQDALAVYVRQCRQADEKAGREDSTMSRREVDPTWVDSCFIALHPSLTCWKVDGKDPADMDNVVKDRVICTADWQKQGKWRRDHVLVEDLQSPSKMGSLQGYKPAQLQLLMTITDIRSTPHHALSRYTCALVDFLKIRGGGYPHKIHGMVEVEPWPVSAAANRRSLGARQVVPLERIKRSVHIVPAYTGKATAKDDISYVNSHADWDLYNSIYDEDLLA